MAATRKTANSKTAQDTYVLHRERDTKNKAVFTDPKDECPLGSIYVDKSYIGSAQTLYVALAKGE